jgi:hypothetical protein
MRSMTSSSSMSETMRISREHFGHRSGSDSHIFLIDSRADRGDKVPRGEDLEVAPNLLAHAGAVEDRSGCRSRLGRPHLFDRKRVAEDVLGEPFYVLARAGEHLTSAVDVEARVNPASQHPGPLGRQPVDSNRDNRTAGNTFQ